MVEPGQVISYWEMCGEEKASLRQGMNYKLHGQLSVILMSLRRDAPYADRVKEEGRVLIYEGHDEPRRRGGPNPKTIDQPMYKKSGRLTQNGLFYNAAHRYQEGEAVPELVKVYEKLHRGIWVYNGVFRLVDAWQESSGVREVFKFRLELIDKPSDSSPELKLERNRLIPSWVKLEVWKRDKGRCVICGSKENLHFDHIIPYSRGGSSLVPENIQILCARHNLEKRARII